MIRFINIGNQIDDKNRFAFYDTITDRFIGFNGSQSWDNVADFEKDFTGDDIDRYKRLINHNWRIVVDDIDDNSNRWTEFTLNLMGFPLQHFDCGVIRIPKNQLQIEYLKTQLQKAVNHEDYLQAEELKLQIQALKNER